MSDYRYEIGYGKHAVPVYRTRAAPLRGLTTVPESAVVGRNNEVFAFEIDLDVLGDDFLPAYTHGDNSMVIATDSMKNFILRESLAFDGATAEGLLHFLGTRFIATYERPRALRLAAREIAFDAATVPAGGGFGPSEVLFARVGREITVATLELRRDGANATIVDHHCGRVGLRLMKTTGSSFTSFVRDNYTTLPDRRDRPLYIFMDVGWRYGEATDALGVDPARYVAGEQVSDVLRTVFHQFVSESIQHLLHEMGTRVLARFPTLAAVDFRAENRTRDPVVESPGDPLTKVYTDPFPAFGRITLRMSRAAG